jgi:DNA-binding transcriptional regulator YiaG
MDKKSKRKSELYNGLGFPVLLMNPRYIKTKVGWALDVNSKKLMEIAFAALIRKPGRLSGAEIKFIRHRMELTQNTFAELLQVDRSLISKWEGKDLKSTEMQGAVEGYLRIQMVKFLRKEIDKEFSFIESAIRKSEVGKPMELSA